MRIRLIYKLIFAAIVMLAADKILLAIKFNAVPQATMGQPAVAPAVIQMPPLYITGSVTKPAPRVAEVNEVAEIWDNPCPGACTQPHLGDGDGEEYQVDVPMTDETQFQGPADAAIGVQRFIATIAEP